MFTCAKPWHDLEKPNPCYRIRKNKEKGDDTYITDEEFFAVYRRAPRAVRNAMALAYITGQRQGDIIRIERANCKPDGLYVEQGKTGKFLCIAWTPALRKAVHRCAIGVASVRWLIVKTNGQRYTESGFQQAWQNHRNDCLECGVLSRSITFRAIRAKAHTDGEDRYLLGHENPDAMDKIYRRKPRNVRPVR